MAKKNDSWGIEVGQYAIKAMRLVRTGDRVDVADWDVLPFKQILSTPDLNVDEAIQVGLDAFMTKHPDVERSRVVVSVPGHLAFARFAKLPPVEPKKIPSIVGYEAQQQIPFPIEQVEWDYQVFQQVDAPDVEVGIFAITKERVMQFLTNYRAVGLRIDELTLSPLAVYNAFAYDNADGDDDLEGSVYMDIGTTSTDVIIVESGGIWLRTLPIGGNHFTEALVKAFKISFSKAERYKREAATSKYSRQIFSAMRPVFADLVQEIQRSIGYYQSLNRDAELKQIVCVGSTFKLPGLSKFLKQQLQMKVIRPDRYQKLHVEGKQEAEFSTRVINLASAYGLALQGLGLDRVSANILPSYLIRQRMWKAKQPWIGAAAACVALGAGLAVGRYYMDYGAWQTKHEEVQRVVDRVDRQARGFNNRYNELSSDDQRLRIENMRRLLDYRTLYPKLLEDISQAAMASGPQPQTMSVNYDELTQIPRHQRQRIYIEKVDTQYLVGEDPTLASRRGSGEKNQTQTQMNPENRIGKPHTINEFWKPGVGEPVANTQNNEDETAPADAAQVASTLPRIEVTVTGWTPYHERGNANLPPAGFLNQTFIRYLLEQSGQGDRPYRILVGAKPIVSLGKVGALEGNTGGGARPGGRPAARPGGRPGAAAPGMIPGAMPGMIPGGDPMMGMMGGARGGNRGGNTNLDDLYSVRPLSEEDRSQDWRFELKFTIELLKPDQARQAEMIADPSAPAPETDPQSPQNPETEPPQASLGREEVRS